MTAALTAQQAHQLMWAAHELFRTGRYSEAGDRYAWAVQVFASIGDRTAEGEARANLGQVLIGRGRHEAARTELGRALALAQVSESVPLERAVTEALGQLLLDCGDIEGASPMLHRALSLAEAEGVRQHVGAARLGLHQLHLELGQHDLAEAQLAVAEADARATWDERLAFACACARATLLQEQGRLDEAERAWLGLAGKGSSPDERALRLLGLGAVRLERALASRKPRPAEAVREPLEDAWEIYAELQDPHGAAACRTRLAWLEVLGALGGTVSERAPSVAEAGEHLEDAVVWSGDHATRQAALAVSRGMRALVARRLAAQRGDPAALAQAQVDLAEARGAGTPWVDRSARVRRALRWLGLLEAR